MDAAQDGLNAATGPLQVGLVIASLETGGAQTMVLRLAAGLAGRGHSVRLLCLDGGPAPALQEIAHPLPPSVEMTFLSPTAPRGTLAKILAAPTQCRALATQAQRHGLHAVISFMERANIVNLLRGGPSARIVSIRSHPRALLESKSRVKATLIRLLYPRLLRHANAVVLNSADSAHGLAELFPLPPGRAVVIPNFCDVDALRSAGQGPLLPTDEALFRNPVVLACGRLIHDKGFVPLLRAFASLGQRGGSARLVIVGEGPQRPVIEAAIAALDLNDRAVLTGHRANPLPLMARASIFCLPSLREGFPNALLEAMACGIPVVGTDCPGGVAEILAPDRAPGTPSESALMAAHGMLVPALEGGSVEVDAPLSLGEKELAEALATLLANADLRQRLGRAAAARAADFHQDRILPQWENLLIRHTASRP